MFNRIWAWITNDYKIVEVVPGEWRINVRGDLFGNYVKRENCRFEIMYSKILNEYRLDCYGYKPKEHPIYPIVIELLQNYRKRIR